MELAQRRMNPKPLLLFGFVLIVALMSILFAYVRNAEHALIKHGNDAVLTKESIRTHICLAERFYYSPIRGTVLVLCQINTVNWGGIPIRFTEDYGKKYLGKDTYECTAFIGSWKYWDNVIKRDKYLSPEDFIRFADGKVFVDFMKWFEANYR